MPLPPSPQSPPPSSPPSSPPIASLLSRLARRHSLPASSILNPLDLPASTPGEPTHPDATTATTRPNTSDDAIGGVGRGRGHRHTRSDAPVVVRRYNPPKSTEAAAAKRGSRVLSLLGIEREADVQDTDPGLPSIEDFSFDGIMRAVEPEVTKTTNAIVELCTHFQNSVRTEIHALTDRQQELNEQMHSADVLTTKTLKTTKARAERLEAEGAPLKNGKAVNRLATATESTHALLTSMISTLLLIDEMLPPQDRLSPITSAHKNHYPNLHRLLAQKSVDLGIGLSSQPRLQQSSKGNGKRNVNHTSLPCTFIPPDDTTNNTTLYTRRRRRISSASLLQHNTNPGYGTSPLAPQLQLQTILPETAAAVLTASSHGSPGFTNYSLGISPGTRFHPPAESSCSSSLSAHIGMAPITLSSTSPGTVLDDIDASSVSHRRRSSVWTLHNASPRPNTPGGVFPIDEEPLSSETHNSNSNSYFPTQPTTPMTATSAQPRRMSWKGSGSWSSGLGGWLGGRRGSGWSQRSGGGREGETARESLERVLSAGVAEGRRVRAGVESWGR